MSSLVASSTAPERPEESEDLLGGEAVFDDDFLGIIEELRDSVYELSGMSKSEAAACCCSEAFA